MARAFSSGFSSGFGNVQPELVEINTGDELSTIVVDRARVANIPILTWPLLPRPKVGSIIVVPVAGSTSKVNGYKLRADGTWVKIYSISKYQYV